MFAAKDCACRHSRFEFSNYNPAFYNFLWLVLTFLSSNHHVNSWPCFNAACIFNYSSIPEEQPLQIVPQRSPKHVPETPGPDLQCQLLQRWNDLPTMLIEIKPKFILNNQSNQNLFVRDAGTHLIWGFQRAAVLTSPAIQVCINSFCSAMLHR